MFLNRIAWGEESSEEQGSKGVQPGAQAEGEREVLFELPYHPTDASWILILLHQSTMLWYVVCPERKYMILNVLWKEAN